MVRITAGKLTHDFLKGNWRWLWAAVLLPLLGLWAGRRRGRGGASAQG